MIGKEFKRVMMGIGKENSMVKYKKKELLQMVDTLKKANDRSREAGKTDLPGVMNVLIQCQEAAIILGEYIETLGERYECFVKIL